MLHSESKRARQTHGLLVVVMREGDGRGAGGGDVCAVEVQFWLHMRRCMQPSPQPIYEAVKHKYGRKQRSVPWTGMPK